MPTKLALVNILRETNGTLEYSEDDDTYAPVTPTTITGTAINGNLIMWVGRRGVSKINEIRLKNSNDSQFFKKEPKGVFGDRLWVAQLKKNIGEQEIGYDIVYTDDDGNVKTIDPKVKTQTSDT